MLKARHAAIIAGLGIAGAYVLPNSALALEGVALSGAAAVNPYLAFPVGIVAGLAVGGLAYVAVRASQNSRAKPVGKHSAEYVDALNRERAAQNTIVEAHGAKHMRLDAEVTLAPVGAHARIGRHFATRAEAFAIETLEDRVPSPELADYESIAQGYVASERQEEKKAVRSRGVAAVLLERIGQKNDFPTIERGISKIDESESWWGDVDSVADTAVTASAPEELPLPELSAEEKRAIARENAEKRRAAEIITRSVPLVDQGVYPERRSAEELAEGEDLWTTALAAMDDLMPTEAFADNVGSAETIDEPDGLELPTEFLSIETHERVPEFYDATAFVDFAEGNETAQPTAPIEPQPAGAMFKVIEGGSQNTARLPRIPRASRPSRDAQIASRERGDDPANTTGRHFSEAKEA